MIVYLSLKSAAVCENYLFQCEKLQSFFLFFKIFNRIVDKILVMSCHSFKFFPSSIIK